MSDSSAILTRLNFASVHERTGPGIRQAPQGLACLLLGRLGGGRFGAVLLARHVDVTALHQHEDGQCGKRCKTDDDLPRWSSLNSFLKIKRHGLAHEDHTDHEGHAA
ncbi:MAG: hypothetical protein IPM01_05500 [Burkholderiaceae bacterium]|nr:hypothetical protein [Burkholderiaceae bacterium]